MNSLKVLISISTLEVGGAQTFALGLASRLAKNGHQVIFFVWNDQKVSHSMKDELLDEKVDYVDISSYSFLSFIGWKSNAIIKFLGFKFDLRSWLVERLYRRVLAKYRVDLVSSFLVPSDLSCVQNTPKHIPIIVTEEGDYLIRKRKEEVLPRSLLQRVNGWVAVSSFARKQLSEYLPCPIDQIRLIYNAMPFDGEREEVPANSMTIGMVARGHIQKGWVQLIEAYNLAKSKCPRIDRLVLVGEGLALDDLRKKYENQEDVYFEGYSSNPSEIIQSFHVGVLPSYFQGETFGISVLEYLCQGRPAIVSNWGGLPEVVQYDGVACGQIIEMDPNGQPHVEQLAEAILRYVEDETLYRSHKENIPQVIKRFEWSHILDQYLELYQEHMT